MKIHAICALPGRSVTLALTAGHVSDIRAADLFTGDLTRFRRLVAGKAYDCDRFRKTLRQAGTAPVIPGRSNRKRPIRHDPRRTRDSWRSEIMFSRLKDFRRIATR